MPNNFSHLTEDQLYQEFREDSWKRHSRAERIALLQEVENRVAAEQGRPAMQIDVIPPENDAPGLQGYYIDGKNRLYINERFVKPSLLGLNDYSAAAALDTVLHEGRHAFQHDFLRRFDKRASRQMGLEWALNTCMYVSANAKSSDLQKALYVFQPLELDARRYARQRLRRINQSICAATGKEDSAFTNAIDSSVRLERYYAALALKELTPEVMDRIDRIAADRFRASNPNIDISNISLFRETMRMIESIDRLSDDPDLIDGSFDSRRVDSGSLDDIARRMLDNPDKKPDGDDDAPDRFGFRPTRKGMGF